MASGISSSSAVAYENSETDLGDSIFSEDGSTLAFASQKTRRSDEIGAPNTGSIDIYRYRNGAVTLLSPGGRPPSTGEVPQSGDSFLTGMSADGTRIWFNSNKQLDPRDHDDQGDTLEWTESGTRQLGDHALGFLGASDDGSVAYFSSFYRETSADHDDREDIYLAQDGALKLITAGGEEEDEDHSAALVSRSGDIAFYSNADQLPSDTDGLPDIYLYKQGTLHVVSTQLGAAEGDPSVKPALLGLSDDGTRVAYGTEPKSDGYRRFVELFLYNDGVEQVRTVAPATQPYPGTYFAALSADGSDFFFERSDGDGYFDFNDASGTTTSVPPVLRVSPSGDRVLTESPDPQGTGIRTSVIDLATNQSQVISSTAGHEFGAGPDLSAASPELDDFIFLEREPLSRSVERVVLKDGSGAEVLAYEPSDPQGFPASFSPEADQFVLRTSAPLDIHDVDRPGSKRSHRIDDYLFDREGNVRLLTQAIRPLDTSFPYMKDGPYQEGSTDFGIYSTQRTKSIWCRYWRLGEPIPEYSKCEDVIYTRSLRTGTYRIQAYAVSLSGEVDDSPADETFEVDGQPPQVTVQKTRRGSQSAGLVHFRIRKSEPARARCWLDQRPRQDCRSTFAAEVRRPGRHVLHVTARDRAGNRGHAQRRFRIGS